MSLEQILLDYTGACVQNYAFPDQLPGQAFLDVPNTYSMTKMAGSPLSWMARDLVCLGQKKGINSYQHIPEMGGKYLSPLF